MSVYRGLVNVYSSEYTQIYIYILPIGDMAAKNLEIIS